MSLTKVKASNISLTTAAASSNDTTPATTQYVTTAINNLIDGAPATLNTLDEIAAALNDDAALNTTLTNAIAAKLPLAGGTMTGALTVNHAGGIVTKGGGGLHLQPTDAHDTDAWILYQYSDNTLRYNFTGAGADEIIIKHPASANTTTLTVDTAQIRVGIGTASPSYPLHISGTGSQRIRVQKTDAGGDADIQFYSPSDSTQWVLFGNSTSGNNSGVIKYVHSTNKMHFRTNGTDNRLVLDDSGNVGIGIESPGHSLDVLRSTNGDATIKIKSTAAGDPTLLFDSAAANRNAVIRFLDQGSTVAGRIQYVHNGDRLDFQAGSGTGSTMSIVNGKVGIGIESNMDRDLHIKGSGSDVGIQIEKTGAGELRVAYDSTGPYLYAENTNHGIRMYVGGTEKFNLPPSGRLSVGPHGAATGKRGLRVGRTIYNWFNYGVNAGNTYLHIKTNMLNTTNNTQPTMSMFHIKGYTYSGESIDSMLGFHNWSGAYYNPVYTNNGTRTVISASYAPYTSSDNYVVLVLNIGNNYPGISIDFHQTFEYSFLDVDVTAYTKSNSTSGVY